MRLNEYRKLFRLFSRAERFKLMGLVLMMILAALLEVIGIGMVPAFVAAVASPEKVLGREPLGRWLQSAGIRSASDLLFFGAIALMGVFLVKNAYIVLFHYAQARFLYARLYAFNHRLMAAYLHAPYTTYLQRNTAELLRNVTEEVNRLVNQVLHPLLVIAADSIMALAVLILLLAMEPLITALVIGLIGGGAAVFLVVTQRRMKAYGKRAQICRRGMLKTAAEAFGGIKEARVMNREEHFIEVFRRIAREASVLQRRKMFTAEMPQPTVETIAVAGVLAMALVMHLQGRPIASIVPVMALFGVAIARLMPAVRQITKMATSLTYSIVSVNPVYDDLAALKPHAQALRADRMRNERMTLHHAIVLRDVHYRYPTGESHALRGINLTLPRGKAVAFVGPTGAGKTTVVDVVLGLLQPQQGDVLVDGQSIFSNLSAWQRNIGYIPQYIYLADDTVRRNIAFGLADEEIDEEKLQRAVDQAQLRDLVSELPRGLDTVIGERGARLSGGQRQRIGIARALYHDPQVLVMDEATSQLDTLTEKQIMESVQALKGERTILMIAHRLTTVMNCDTLYLLIHGRLVDQGTYAELLQRNEVFRQMASGVKQTGEHASHPA